MKDLFLELENIQDKINELENVYHNIILYNADIIRYKIGDNWSFGKNAFEAMLVYINYMYLKYDIVKDLQSEILDLKHKIDFYKILRDGIKNKILELGAISVVDFIYFLKFFGLEYIVYYGANFYLIEDRATKQEILINNKMGENIELFVNSGTEIIENPSFAHIIDDMMFDFMKFYVNLKDINRSISIYDAFMFYAKERTAENRILK